MVSASAPSSVGFPEALSERFTGRDPRIDNRLIFLPRMHLAMP